LKTLARWRARRKTLCPLSRAQARGLSAICLLLIISSASLAQAPAPQATAHPAAPSSQVGSKGETPSHRFWDRENAWLFAGVGAARMVDYASTRHLRNNGVNEWLLTNSVVDNRPLFVGIELAGTAASIGVCYLFHRTGHHRAERWVSILHIGVGVGGSIRNYTLSPSAPTE
jgi:hypothetical protein